MRPEPNERLDRFRLKGSMLGDSPAGVSWGAFRVGDLNVISSGDGPDCGGWEHVSVSHAHRCPTWQEMCRVKDLFWSEDETVLQFHPRRTEYINLHPNCLHLWRQSGVDHPLPDRIRV